MILDQKIEKKEKEKKKRKKKKEKRKKKRKENPGLATTHFILLPPHQSLRPDCCSSSPVPGRKQAEKRGGSRGQGWANALTLVEGPPCGQDGGDPPHPTPIIWEKNKRERKFLGGGKNNQIPSFNYSCETKYWEGGGREGGASVPQVSPLGPPPPRTRDKAPNTS